ncbi:hypothetical protein BD770DRAFT_431121 [Pilaira anomala]|nr:hypothetical protein BD770DRAFT_431121 [Pilaira anomala]
MLPQDEDFLKMPLKPKHVLQAIDFYLTFIRRKCTTEGRKHRLLRQSTWIFSAFSQASTIVSQTEDVCELQGHHHLTLQVFEQARKEVFRSIFSELFPLKYISRSF